MRVRLLSEVRFKVSVVVCLLSLLVLDVGVKAEEQQHFYCGFINEGGTELDYAKWEKGADFKFNKKENRWEWISDYSSQFIYPDGKYVQVGRPNILPNQSGVCNKKMEKAYNIAMAAIRRKYEKGSKK